MKLIALILLAFYFKLPNADFITGAMHDWSVYLSMIS